MLAHVVHILSGGLDSAVLLYHLLDMGLKVEAITFDYGQRHADREIESAQALCHTKSVPQTVVNLKSITSLISSSALTNPDIPVPLGHYESETMRQTVVPNRNMIMASIAAGHAVAQRADYISLAVHAGDHVIYPDCRERFILALNVAIHLATDHITVLAPFVALRKADIVRRGYDLGVPFGITYSCYKGGERHCGECGTCTERQEAFKLAGIKDLTVYENR